MPKRIKSPISLVPAEGPFLAFVGGWTEERYFAEAPESMFVEFADGELIVPSPVSIRHQDVTGFLAALIRYYVESNHLGQVFTGPAVVRLRPGLNYEPDVFFVDAESLDRLETQYFSGPPGLVIEVLSTSTRNYDLRVKASNYHQHGVPEYWVVDLERRRLLVHLLSSGIPDAYSVVPLDSGRWDSVAIPGFWIDVSWLWQEPLPGGLACLRQILPGALP